MYGPGAIQCPFDPQIQFDRLIGNEPRGRGGNQVFSAAGGIFKYQWILVTTGADFEQLTGSVSKVRRIRSQVNFELIARGGGKIEFDI